MPYFKDDVTFYITLNEPDVFTLNGYLRGVWPPQQRSILAYYRITANLIRSHRRAYAQIKQIQPSAQIGVAVNLTFFESAGGVVNAIAVRALNHIRNRHFLRHVGFAQDFIGVNYYFHCYFNYGIVRMGLDRISDLGWELLPQGIYEVLSAAKKFGKPFYITENGLADMRDEKRAWFIRETLRHVRRAMDDGADVRGYFHWSLLDNFEWDKGFWPRFGLVEVDSKTFERRIRPSAWEYKKIIDADRVS